MNYCGLMVTEHAPPPGAMIFGLKICENCSVPFMRKTNGGTVPFSVKDYDSLDQCLGEVELRRDTGKRYCTRCQSRALAPIELEDYKAQLPGTAMQMRHSAHLPKIDHSLPISVLKEFNRSAQASLGILKEVKRPPRDDGQTIKARYSRAKARLRASAR